MSFFKIKDLIKSKFLSLMMRFPPLAIRMRLSKPLIPEWYSKVTKVTLLVSSYLAESKGSER